MNPEAENLREGLRRCSDAWATHHRKWLYDNADAVAELVDAAMDAVNTGRIEGVEGGELNRLARAVADFKGPPSPPQPARTYREGILCPAQDCTWWIDLAGHRSADSAYRAHYRQTHQGGKS